MPTKDDAKPMATRLRGARVRELEHGGRPAEPHGADRRARSPGPRPACHAVSRAVGFPSVERDRPQMHRAHTVPVAPLGILYELRTGAGR